MIWSFNIDFHFLKWVLALRKSLSEILALICKLLGRQKELPYVVQRHCCWLLHHRFHHIMLLFNHNVPAVDVLRFLDILERKRVISSLKKLLFFFFFSTTSLCMIPLLTSLLTNFALFCLVPLVVDTQGKTLLSSRLMETLAALETCMTVF